ncbi:MAG: sulfatase-like hydrolase/transferase [Bacteroides sp.]|jgi:arylsulfatase A-like enzyme|nr:sulfatase-like hydrolase/transferase [Bacteroides sp.]
MKRTVIYSLLAANILPACKGAHEKEGRLPNVIIIYSDDVGYGDIGVYEGRIPTPNIDRLARNGLMFTNAYSPAATSTPSRFSMLTGEYAWRSPGRNVANADLPALIQSGKETWPSVMKRAGYATSVIGKWHLGFGNDNVTDWNGILSPGPLEVGFDYAWLIPATNDRVPTVYVENNRVVNLDSDDPIQVDFKEKVGDRPTGYDHPELLKMMYTYGHDQTITNGISRIGFMKGGESALWRDEDIADMLVDKAVNFIDRQNGKPFFMYFAPVDIHVPRIVHERFQGITSYGPRGEMMVQLDWTVGAIVEALQKRRLLEKTIIIFTSDNGPVLDDGYADFAADKLGYHNPFGPFRGGKYSVLEAGSRVPLIVQWPGFIEAGKISEALFSHLDFLASFAAFLGQDYDHKAAMDSQNHWETLIGLNDSGSQGLVLQAIMGVLAYVREDGYKYIAPGPETRFVPWAMEIETGFEPGDQLFNIFQDRRETINLAGQKPEILFEIKKELQAVINYNTK